MNTVEQLWTAARNRHGNFSDRRTPSAGISAVLLALRDGPSYGSEIARRTGRDQGNVSVWLRKLDRFDLIIGGEVIPSQGHQGGGRPAVFWELTRAGCVLAEALVAERSVRT